MRSWIVNRGLRGGKPLKGSAFLLGVSALVMLLFSGCRTAASTVGNAASIGDAGLDETGRLALGVLQLEGTDNTVTEEQAVDMLPLWQLLQGSTLTSEAESVSVVNSIEGLLSAEQLSAVSAVDASPQALTSWMETQGALVIGPGGAPGTWQGAPDGGELGAMPERPGSMAPGGEELSDEDRAAMRERLQSMTPEERATQMAAQGFQPPTGAGEGRTGRGGQAPGLGQTGAGVAPAGGVSSRQLVTMVIRLLSQRSGQGMPEGGWPGPGGVGGDRSGPGEPAPAGTEDVPATPEAAPGATLTPSAVPEAGALPGSADEGVTVVSSAAELTTPEPTSSTQEVPAIVAEAVQTLAPSPVPEIPLVAAAAPEPVVALEQVADTDPAPPLVVQVATNYAVPSPDLEGGMIYRIGGYLSNPTEDVYAVTALHVTFYAGEGFRRDADPSAVHGIREGEWMWRSVVQADVDCPLIGPGASCPFTVQTVAEELAAFMLHPDAVVAEWHEPATLEASDVRVTVESGYTRIRGTVINPNAFGVKNIVINAVLLDSAGRMATMASDFLMGILASGATALFDVRVPGAGYADYELHTYAEGVFE